MSDQSSVVWKNVRMSAASAKKKHSMTWCELAQCLLLFNLLLEAPSSFFIFNVVCLVCSLFFVTQMATGTFWKEPLIVLHDFIFSLFEKTLETKGKNKTLDI